MKPLHALLVTLFAVFTLTVAYGKGSSNETVNISEKNADSISSRQPVCTLAVDWMSSYVCRGSYQTGPSIQPTLRLSYEGLFFTGWSSVGKDLYEIDLTLGYRLRRFEFALTDYYVSDSGSRGDFFSYGRQSPHTLEVSLSWSVSERVPLTLWWGTMVAGGDFGNDGRRNYSSYAEISYPFVLPGSMEMKTGIGFTPWSTENCFGTKGFAVTNVYLHAARHWRVGSGFRIGLLGRLICNPYKEEFHLVGGLALQM